MQDHTSHRLTIVAVFLFSLAGCSGTTSQNRLAAPVTAALEKPDQFILYSLNPDSRHAPDDKQSEDNFHGYLVLGETSIDDRAEQKKLVDALQRGIAESDGTVAGCFNPRHGIRVVVGDKIYDLVICFECLSALVYEDGTRRQQVLVTKSPQPTFDAALQAGGVKLPKQAE